MIRICLCLFALLLCSGAETPPGGTLSLVEAGIESSEDAPFIAPDYAFAAGEWVYFSFQLAGFKITENTDTQVRQILLKYQAELLDAQGIPLAQPIADTIDQEISPQDKNWQPKRRAAFLLPSYVSAGKYQLKLTVNDELAKSSLSKVFPFQIGGTVIAPTAGLSVQNFRFLREEGDGPALEVPAYRPGDTVWSRFEMVGFKMGAGHSVELEYGFSVLRSNGKMVFEENTAAKENLTDLFYPPQFVPGVLSVNTAKNLAPGEYTIVMRLRDLVGKQSTEFQQKFRIE